MNEYLISFTNDELAVIWGALCCGYGPPTEWEQSVIDKIRPDWGRAGRPKGAADGGDILRYVEQEQVDIMEPVA